MATQPTARETSTATAALRSAESTCPRCGADVEPRQEYCLECGLRLPQARAARPPARPLRRLAGYPTDWVWPVVVAGIVAALAAAIVVGVRELDPDEPLPVLVGEETTGVRLPTSQTATSTLTAPTGTGTTAATTATTPTATAPLPAAPAAPAAGALVAWPSGKNGWTIVLASLPKDGGRSAAVAKAREAADAGLTEVGVLDSDRYSSLHPDYWVVFTGIYDTRGQAEAALDEAGSAGYDEAYARPVTS